MIITPSWPAPKNVQAFTTVRTMGNMATHVADDPATVEKNRLRLLTDTPLSESPRWLNQIHSNTVIKMDASTRLTSPEADGSYTHVPGIVCAVLTADCLPILLCDAHGQEVAALHAGWRGLLAGIIDRGVTCFKAKPSEIYAWLGPAIGPKAFEVGPEVFDAFTQTYREQAEAFIPSDQPRHYLLDIYALARLYLARAGVKQVYGGEFCTYSDPARFYSYRREGKTGRMASLIWMKGTRS